MPRNRGLGWDRLLSYSASYPENAYGHGHASMTAFLIVCVCVYVPACLLASLPAYLRTCLRDLQTVHAYAAWTHDGAHTGQQSHVESTPAEVSPDARRIWSSWYRAHPVYNVRCACPACVDSGREQ
jgi:hypothetical protein